MFGFIKKVFFTAMTDFSCNVLNVNSLKCNSIKIKECEIRTNIIDINNNDPTFYLISVLV